MRWLLPVALAGCAHLPLSTEPSQIARHADEIEAHGAADVEVDQGGTERVLAEDVVSVTLPGNQRSHLWGLVTTGHPDETRTLTIRNLVSGCEGGRPCLATRAVGPVDVGTRRALDPRRAWLGVFGAFATIASIVCLAKCRDPGGWAYVGTGLATATFLVPVSTVF